MNSELLVAWMAHVGSGTWPAFCASVKELSGFTEDELMRLCKSLRIFLSELGYADFFINGTTRWRTRASALAGLSTSSTAMLIGGRNPKILSLLERAACRMTDTSVVEEESVFGLRRVVLTGTDNSIREVARLAGIPYISNMSLRLIAAERPLHAVLVSAPRRDELINWDPYSWDFELAKWVPGRQPNTARRYIDRFLRMHHMVHRQCKEREDLLLLEDPFVAVFGAAADAGVRLVEYDIASHVLKVPRRCPLPRAFARAACLAGGRPSKGEGDKLVYSAVVPSVAFLMMARLGQPLPDIFLQATDRRS